MEPNHTLAFSLDELIGSSQNCDELRGSYDRPLDFIVESWRKDKELCKSIILESIAYWKECPDIPDDITIAARIVDQSYLSFLEELTKIKTVPVAVRQNILRVLIHFGSAKSIDVYLDKFSGIVHKLEQSSISVYDVDIASYIMDICKYRLVQAKPLLDRLVKLPRGNRLEYVAKLYLDACLLLFTNGPQQLIEVITQGKVYQEFRAACIYCLGCLKNPSNHAHLESAYTTYARGRRYFEARGAAVEAIVYGSTNADANAFLNKQLAWLTSKYLRRRSYNADVGTILLGARYVDALDQELVTWLTTWLTSGCPELAACAAIALRDHRVDCEELPKAVEKAISSEMSYLTDNPSPLRLMPDRRIKLPPTSTSK
jgi:hypothetical protein